MTFDPEKKVQELLQNVRIAKRAKELNLTMEQLKEALPILIDMHEQQDDQFTKYLTSFFVDENNVVKRVEVRSTYWSKFKYLENIKSLSYENIDFEDKKDFIKEIARKNILLHLQTYFNDDIKQDKGMYIYGEMGIGKTFILKRIAKKFAENNFSVAFFTLPNLVMLVKKSFSNPDLNHKLGALLKEVDYLFLDDIGAEPISTWFRDEFLFSILNQRMQQEKMIFLSSNYSLAKLEQIQARTQNLKTRDYDKAARLVSRIKVSTKEFQLEGSFKRK